MTCQSKLCTWLVGKVRSIINYPSGGLYYHDKQLGISLACFVPGDSFMTVVSASKERCAKVAPSSATASFYLFARLSYKP